MFVRHGRRIRFYAPRSCPRALVPTLPRILVPTLQRGNAYDSMTTAKAGMDSHAGAWEPEKSRRCASGRQEILVPTLLRGNADESMTTAKAGMGSHAGAWEPENQQPTKNKPWAHSDSY